MSIPKLLLADDSVTIQKVVNLTFAERGVDVIAFSDGESALEHFDEVKPDIVLADVNMPGINGYQLCELLRTDNANRELPVVLLVGSFEPFDRDEAQRVGANMHLTKPFSSIAELISKVEGLLTQKAAVDVPSEESPEQELIEFGPDTSDIDDLYEQSFAETVEIPKEQGNEYELAGIDDEMIQTSYAAAEPDGADERSYSTADDAFDFRDVSANVEHLPETADEPEFVLETGNSGESVAREETTDESEREIEVAPSDGQETQDPAVSPGQDDEPTTGLDPEQQVRVYDPFDSFAGEPPPLEEADRTFGAVKFGFEEADLLDLPPLQTPRPAEFQVQKATGEQTEIVTLSPELMEMIVQKVVERLEQKR